MNLSKVFRFLHNPFATKWRLLYHSSAVAAFFTHSVMFNFATDYQHFVELYNVTSQEFAKLDIFIPGPDAIFCIFLFVELCCRFWSSTHIFSYSSCRGFVNYFRAYASRRSLDFLGVFIYGLFSTRASFILNHSMVFILRTLSVLQIFQFNRLLHGNFRMIRSAVIDFNWHFILFFLFLIFLVTIVMTILIYLLETFDPIHRISIFDSFWFTFISISTIGYGDIVPYTQVGKVIFGLIAGFGIFCFALPASFIGTTLSLKTSKDYRKTVHYRQVVRNIQTAWRSRTCSTLASDTPKKIPACIHPKLYSKTSGEAWSHRDCLAISFIHYLRNRIARKQFKRKLAITGATDLSQEDAELWQRVEYVENNIATLAESIDLILNEKIPKLNTLISSIKQDL